MKCSLLFLFLLDEIRIVSHYKKCDPNNGKRYMAALISCRGFLENTLAEENYYVLKYKNHILVYFIKRC